MNRIPSVRKLHARGTITEESTFTIAAEFAAGVGADTLGGLLTSTANLLKAISKDMGATIEVYVLSLTLTDKGFKCKMACVPVTMPGNSEEQEEGL